MTWHDWLAPGAVVALFGALIAAVKLRWIELPRAKDDRARTDADIAKAKAEVEDLRVDTAEQLIAMVRAELAHRDARMANLEAAILEHRVWDMAVADELQRLDPDAMRRIGRPPTLTF